MTSTAPTTAKRDDETDIEWIVRMDAILNSAKIPGGRKRRRDHSIEARRLTVGMDADDARDMADDWDERFRNGEEMP